MLVRRGAGVSTRAIIAPFAFLGPACDGTLLIGTTNLDAGRPVIWDVARIAMSDTPGARRPIHEVMRASSAIPGAFPPVMFRV